jgi:hypothetical protein
MVAKPEGNKTLGRGNRTSEGDIKIDFKKQNVS